MAAILSVNINKIATLRNSRGGNTPDLVKVALDCVAFGAQGITVHPRPDQRHIKYADVTALKKVLSVELNVEGYPTEDFLNLCAKVKPAQVTLVPDAPNALTSNNGWDCKANEKFLKDVTATIHGFGARVSLFLNADPRQLPFVKSIAADRIELYTGPYADAFLTSSQSEKETLIAPFRQCAIAANSINIGVNAGHDLSLQNLTFFNENIPALLEVSIGHALICDALYYGLENAINMYKKCLQFAY